MNTLEQQCSPSHWLVDFNARDGIAPNMKRMLKMDIKYIDTSLGTNQVHPHIIKIYIRMSSFSAQA
jgi:hypothetical protein